MYNYNKTFLLVSCFFLFASLVQGIAVLDKRVENPKPDGSGTVFIQIAANPADADFASLTGFSIVEINFPNAAQSLRLWNAVASDCSGSLLTATSGSNSVPADGKLCFISNTTVLPEFQSSFKFVAVGGTTAAPNGTVTIINYNRQACKGIPDLGGSGSFKAPPKPTVSITLAGLQIKFSVNATYLRNQTTWYLDFFDFNSAASGDSADGTGRTCCNHKASNYGSSFSNWWYSAVRATYNTGVHSSIDNALGTSVYPNYNTAGTDWTVTALDCSTINFEATIPVSRLVGNATTDCHKTGSISPAATTSGGLVYSGTLYVHALRPIDATNPAGGYYKSAFAYPFTFSLATTISNIVSSSAKWAFSVAVLNSVVTYTGGSPSFTMDLQTSIDSPTLSSPNVLQAGFALNSFPQKALRDSIPADPTLSRLSDNGACTGASTSACVINWRMVMPQLSLAQLSNVLSDFDTQYSGKYGFTWTTETVGDVLASDIYVDVSAVNPSTNLSQIPVNSSVNFFATQSAMQDTTNPGQTTPLFSSGEKIWVRHSFLVDQADIKAFVFNLKQAYVCFSNVPGFTPGINSGRTGCSVDIPGVMEAANGERYVLYDVNALPGGIADVSASQPGQQSKVWGWTPIGPTDSSWTSGATVNNGFSINAQPLAVDGVARTYYFHLISTVTQTALGRRSTRELHHFVRVANGDNAGALDGVKIVGASASDATELSPALFNVVREMLW